MRVRVAIADDQPLVRDGFRVQLGLAGDMEFAGEASTGEQAVALARRERPDVLLMDVRMPVLDGIEATRRITADPRTSGVRVLVLTTFDIGQYVFAALRAGAGLVTLATPDIALASMPGLRPEVMAEPLAATAGGAIDRVRKPRPIRAMASSGWPAISPHRLMGMPAAPQARTNCSRIPSMAGDSVS